MLVKGRGVVSASVAAGVGFGGALELDEGEPEVSNGADPAGGATRRRMFSHPSRSDPTQPPSSFSRNAKTEGAARYGAPDRW
jgi:hypothetical protein